MEDISIPISAPSAERTPSLKERLLAWSVHLLTATGAIWAFLSIIDINQQRFERVFIWMAIAVLVDSFDGYAARAARVKTVLPDFEGALLDNIVDYLNYVFVPAYFLYAADLLPEQFLLIVPVLILLSSAYQFSQGDAKTADHCFTGFPSYWNVVVWYMVMLGAAPWTYALILLFLVLMVFVPIKYIYPSRTTTLPRLTMGLGMVWALFCITITILFPNQPGWLVWLSLLYPVYYYGLSFYLSFRRADPVPA